jgi:eukaryotic-like serine/threonine-protein kinase
MEQTIPSVENILAEAVEIAPAERRAFVAQACGGNAELRAKVERLLANHDRAGSFLEHPAMVLGTVALPANSVAVGTRIGPYKLLEIIGEGGMGVVYLAEQREPVRRQVAIKIIKPGMDSKQIVARFEAERQALAMMDHPNIARVLEAGAIDTGHPYFVMELVRGIAITDYCDQARLTVRQRLDVFMQVCRAVQHAHTKGVIHRDLKPSNVLVTSDDGVPVPKVIDFGVAKALEQPLTERTLHTGFAQMVGTPLYMSPEQAEFNLRGVDTRSDIYSLGVLLYELLTGATPFDTERLRAADFDELRRILHEEEPPRPSTRVSTLGAGLDTVSERRGVDAGKLRQTLYGELDWIVLKALEKERDRRYETASAFAADVQRYLNDEQVEACPPSAGYRLRKLVRRNRSALATVSVVVVALVAAAVVSTWQAAVAQDALHQAETDRDRAKTAERQAKTEQDRANTAERQATTEAAIARAVSNFLQDDLLRQAISAPQEEVGPYGNQNLTVREALHRASAKVAERFGDQPLVEAAIRSAIGQAYGSLGDIRLETAHLERALQLRQAHLGPDHPETLRTMERLAGAFTWVGRVPEGIVLYEQLLEKAKSRHGPGSPEALGLMNSLALACRRAGDWQRAMRLLEQVVEKEKALLGPTVAGASNSAHALAGIYQDAGMYVESAARLDKVFALKKLLGSDPTDDLGFNDGRVLAYQRAGRLEDADRLMRRKLELWRKRLDSRGQLGQARMLEFLSLNLLLQNRPAEAEPLAREALLHYEKGQATDLEWRLPYIRNLLGGTLLAQKKYADAEPLLVQGYEGMKQAEAMMIAPWRFRLTEAGERVVRYYEETNQPEKARVWREKLKPKLPDATSGGSK